MFVDFSADLGLGMLICPLSGIQNPAGFQFHDSIPRLLHGSERLERLDFVEDG
jgi:hypothetical protein